MKQLYDARNHRCVEQKKGTCAEVKLWMVEGKSDEEETELEQCDIFWGKEICYWYELKTEAQLFSKWPFVGGSLLISWGVLSTSGNTELLVKEDW